jgi:hypothetical protein
MASKKTAKIQKTLEITFLGGSYDGKVYEFINPAPEYLVMNLGRDLYRKESLDKYRFTDDWTEYNKTIDLDRVIK